MATGRVSTKNDVALLYMLTTNQDVAVPLNPGVGGEVALFGFFHADAQFRFDAPSGEKKPEGQRLAQTGRAPQAAATGKAHHAGNGFGKRFRINLSRGSPHAPRPASKHRERALVADTTQAHIDDR